ncbi:MAG: DUF6701 domain-containing protein [Gammaproteobacteria bacterium]
MRVPARLAALALLAAAAAARADIVLNGNFHAGDEDNRPEFTPLDPVDCDKYRGFPSTFHLSEAATITAFTLHDAVGLDDTDITLDIDGMTRPTLACAGCLTDGTVTIDLVSSVALAAGDHTIAVYDPDSSGACEASNDMGWSALTLVSTATTTSVMLNQRSHIGDSTDGNDWYDTTDNANPFYPDNFEGDPITQLFTLGAARRLTDVRLYRLRDLDTSDAVVMVNGTTLGTLANTGDPNEANPTSVTTNLLLAPGTHSVTVDAGNLSVTAIDDFSWDDIVLRFAATTAAGTPGFFNAVDVGANAVTGSITTKVAGGAFTLDLYALNGFGTGQNTGYNGNATVDVLNASDSSGTTDVYGCNSNWTPVQSGSVTFVAGHVQVSGTFLTAGLKEARIKVTDSATGAAGCSIDNFAVRPADFQVEPTHDTHSTAGLTTALTNVTTGGAVIHRAGRPFTIVATARGSGGATVTNYDGTPDTPTATVIAPATVIGSMNPPPTWTVVSPGVRRTDTAAYTEVGAVTLKVEDTTWANVDADDTAASQRSFSGTAATGRFVPDHFKVTAGTLTPGCAAGAFSYLGAALAWATPAVTLTAESAGNTTTMNYVGALEKFPDTVAQPAFSALTGTIDTSGMAAPAIGPWVAGVTTITLDPLRFERAALVGAFDAEIEAGFAALPEDDGIVPTGGGPIVLGAPTAGNGIAFTGSAKSQRFGRLYLEPRYGSERLPMTVPLRAEYFDGVSFVHNAADACTTLVTGNVTLAPLGGQAHAVASNGNGRWTVTLSAPNVSGQAGLSIDLAAPGATVPYPLLTADSNGDGTYAEDPATTLTFGLRTQEDRRIYQREVVGN